MRINRRMLLAGAVAAPALRSSAYAQETPDPPWMIMAGQDSGPAGRWGHSLVIDTWNNRLLVIGGRDADGIVRGDLWSFDIGAYAWSELDLSGPKARSGSAAAIAPDGSGFYYFGGSSDDATFDDLWWFDFAATTWERIETGLGPSARTDTRGTIDVFGRFVISHGRNGDQLFDDTWAFDPVEGTWAELASTSGIRPSARYGHGLISLPSYGILLLTCGAADISGAIRLGDLWSFDIYNNLWADITPLAGPSPRTGAAVSRQGETVLLVGGDADIGLKSDVWNGDLFQGYFAWSELTPVNHGPLGIYRRAWHDMTAANGEYYVFGGRGVEGALSDLWRFSPERITQPGRRQRVHRASLTRACQTDLAPA